MTAAEHVTRWEQRESPGIGRHYVARCSCGWRSKTLFGFPGYAERAAEQHVRDVSR